MINCCQNVLLSLCTGLSLSVCPMRCTRGQTKLFDDVFMLLIAKEKTLGYS